MRTDTLKSLHSALTAALPLAGSAKLHDGPTAAELRLEATLAEDLQRPLGDTYYRALAAGVTDDEEALRRRLRDEAAVAALLLVLRRYLSRAYELGGRMALDELGLTGDPTVDEALIDEWTASLVDPYSDISLTNTTAVDLAREVARRREAGEDDNTILTAIAAYVTARVVGRADLTAQTEVTRLTRRGLLAVYTERAAVTHVIFRTQGDGRVCAICQPLDGKRFEIIGGIVPMADIPIHGGCRCGYEPVLE